MRGVIQRRADEYWRCMFCAITFYGASRRFSETPTASEV